MTITRYLSKPSAIEAVLWDGTTEAASACVEFAGAGKVRFVAAGATLDRSTDEMELRAGVDGAQGWVPVPVGHWLVSNPGDRSDVWPVDPGYFAGKYQPEGDLYVEPEPLLGFATTRELLDELRSRFLITARHGDLDGHAALGAGAVIERLIGDLDRTPAVLDYRTVGS